MDWKRNQLNQELSPYLKQHQHNPVWWQAWSNQALDLAQETNRLLIVSIGYSACHWCHVMEHESFSNEEVAAVMNQRFICIKVDREERPDIDNRYMQAAMLSSRQGGWPLNAIALPDGRPVFAGTYFPKDRWLALLVQFHRIWATEPNKMVEAADHLIKGMAKLHAPPLISQQLLPSLKNLHNWKQEMHERLDPMWGGPDRVPRFPMPAIALAFLADEHALSQNLHTWLMRMAAGGIHDHLGGGFARYATDGQWTVPHFEKMLYDNGQLLEAYALAFRKNRNPLWSWVASGIVHWLQNDMRLSDARLMAALDADSEGEEGWFYTWLPEEIEALPKQDFEQFKQHYDWQHQGNFEGRLVLWNPKGRNLPPSQADQAWMNHLKKLRHNKIPPAADNKAILSWNALAARGLAHWLLAMPQDNTAKKLLHELMDALWQTHRQPETGKWFRLGLDYKHPIPAFLEDLAAMGLAMCSTAQAIDQPIWWERAEELAQEILNHFSLQESPLLSDQSSPDPITGTRPMELGDNVIPSANSMAARFFLELGSVLANPKWLDRSRNMATAMAERTAQEPFWHAGWVWLFEDLIRPRPVLKFAPDAFETARELWNETALFPWIARDTNLPKGHLMVCQGNRCLLSTNDKAALRLALEQMATE